MIVKKEFVPYITVFPGIMAEGDYSVCVLQKGRLFEVNFCNVFTGDNSFKKVTSKGGEGGGGGIIRGTAIISGNKVPYFLD